MACVGCEKTDTCTIDFDDQLSSLRSAIAQLRQESDGAIADTDPRLDQLLSRYPVCVQLALVELNFMIGISKFSGK